MSLQQMLLGAGGAKTYVDDVFSNYLYTGNDSTQAINNGIDLAGKGGMLWIKSRNASQDGVFMDTARGVTKSLYPSGDAAEYTASGANEGLSSFNSNGFTAKLSQGNAGINNSSNNNVSWTFRKAKGFFDIVTYEGTGTTQNISHGLGSVPGLIMIKKLNSTGDWVVFHRDRGNGGFGKLNTTDTFWTGNDIWDSTTPTSTTFRVNGNNSFVNADDDDYIAYIFAGGESTAATATSVKFTQANDGLTIADHADFNVGSGDFTMEMWYRPTVNTVAGRTLGQSNSTWTDGTGPMIEMDGGEAKLYMKDTSNNWIAAGKEMGKTYANQWHHLAVSRTGSSLKGFNNGIQQFEITTSATVMDVTGDFGIGTNAAGSGVPSGSISNVRFVKGQGLYTSSFSPSLEPLTTTSQGATASNVKLLCCQGSTLTAATVTPGTITSTNNVSNSWSSDSPFDDPAGFKFGANGNKPIIKCGSWTGDGSTTDVPIDMGFEPQWIMIKNVTTGGGGWNVLDNMRGWASDNNDTRLEADDSGSEYSGFNYSDLTATGCVTGTTTGGWNSSDTFIYIAIRRPDGGVGKTPEAGTDVFAMDTGGSSADMDPPNFDAPFAVDMAIWRDTDSYDNWFFGLRSAGTSKLKPDVDASESAESGHTWDSSAGWSSLNKGSDCVSWMWKRSPGFFDCRTITCTAAADTLYDHGLGVVPEMMWFKSFDNGGSYDDWIVYHKDLDSSAPEDKYVKLSETDSVQDNTVWADTAPTATQFKIGSAMLAADDKFSVCLFASLEGVSKIGVYQATSPEANRVITTGFQPRFVMIKCIDSAEPWMVFDTLRGVGNLLKLDNAAVQSSGTFISIQSTGFTVTSTSSELNNDNDDKYLYYAIA